tara:strand:+ start:1362 stop:2069 length:708 start_codon:yes stop_codon:yes gene_type:complete
MIFSPSAMNQFFTCPAQYNYQRIEHRPTIYTNREKADVGIDVHSAIQYYFAKVQPKPRKIELTDGIKRAWSEVIGDRYRSNRELNHRVLQSMKNFTNFEIHRRKNWKVYMPTYTEKHLQNEEYRGIIDWYNEDMGVIIDWKTGNMNELTMKDHRQGEVYKNLLNSINKPVNNIYFVNLSSGRILEMPRIKDGWLKTETSRIESAIESNDFPKHPSKLCGYCPYVISCELEGENLW